MAKVEVRTGSKIVLDSEREGDLIAIAENLNKRHMMSELMTTLFRLAADSTGELKSEGADKYFNHMISLLSSAGISNERKKYFDSLEGQLKDMHSKVDATYDMAMKTLTLAKVNEVTGIEEKSEKTLMSTFVVERELSRMESAVGKGFGTFESSKLSNTKEKANEIMEYIVETYDSILKEVREKAGSGREVAVPQTKEVVRTEVDNTRCIELERKIEELERRNNELEEENKELQKKNKLLENENNDSKEETAALKAKIVKLKDMNEELEEENRLLERKVKRLSNRDNNDTEKEVNTSEKEESKEGESEAEGDAELDFGETADISALATFFGM